MNNKSKQFDLIVIFFFLVCIGCIYVTNLKGGVFLSGWDNLHPEFNYGINISRAFFSTWQEYQGTGLPAGNAHATELFKEIIMIPLSFILPIFQIRKVFFMFMLFLGPMGVYTLLKYIFLKNNTLYEKTAIGCIGGLFYLFHIATVQIFYTPYESFSAYYAFLPLMVFSLYYCLEKMSKKRLLFALAIHIIGSISFYIPTLFVVYGLIVSVLLFTHVLVSRSIQALKTISILLLTVVIANLYWILPFIYYVHTNIDSQLSSYLNFIFSEDIFQKNVKFGNIKDIVMLKGFLFDYIGTVQNTPQYVMGVWREFTTMPLFVLAAIISFIIMAIGAIKTFHKPYFRVLTFLFLIFFSLLAFNVPPFSLLNHLLHSNNLFHQVFRNLFTKFANSLLFVESILFAVGTHFLITRMRLTVRLHKYVNILFIFAFFAILSINLFPIWQGNLIYPALKTSIPKEYFDLFTYFKNMPDGRITNLPQFSSDGWYTYRFGYTGSGFIWYGIPQPIMDRSFDVWSRNNENYYWELSQAIYSQNLNQLENIFDKYGISWIISDNMLTANNPKTQKYVAQTEQLLESSYKILLEKKFGGIKVYKFQPSYPIKQYISILSQPPSVNPYSWSGYDAAYAYYGPYQSITGSSSQDTNIFFPFRSLLTNRKNDELPFVIEETDFWYIFRSTIPNRSTASVLKVPPLTPYETVNFNKNNLSQQLPMYANILLNGKLIATSSVSSRIEIPIFPSQNNSILEIQIPKQDGIYSKVVEPVQVNSSSLPVSCNKFNTGDMKKSIDGSLVELASRQSSNCLQFSFPDLSQQNAYVISIQNKYIEGSPLFTSIYNTTSKKTETETYLVAKPDINTQYFIVPPREKYGLGYNITLDNISQGDFDSINQVGKISFYPVPYYFLSHIQVNERNFNSIGKTNIGSYTTSHPHPDSYIISINDFPPNDQPFFITLSQSFHNGWKAYTLPPSFSADNPLIQFISPLIGKQLNNHVLINNWMNGWELNEKSDTIVIMYIPQYLQYFGFCCLTVFFIFVLLILPRSNHANDNKNQVKHHIIQ